MLRGISDYALLSYGDAKTLDPQRMSWVKVESVRHRRNNRCDIELAVTLERYAELSAGLATSREIAASIGSAFREESERVFEDDYLRGEVECIPVCSGDTVFGPHTVVVEWTHIEAHHVKIGIQHSIANVGCIELTRLGRMGAKTVTIAVTVPVAIFDATIRKVGQGPKRRAVSECLFEAIEEELEQEPTPPRPMGEAEIPF